MCRQDANACHIWRAGSGDSHKQKWLANLSNRSWYIRPTPAPAHMEIRPYASSNVAFDRNQEPKNGLSQNGIEPQGPIPYLPPSHAVPTTKNMFCFVLSWATPCFVSHKYKKRSTEAIQNASPRKCSTTEDVASTHAPQRNPRTHSTWIAPCKTVSLDVLPSMFQPVGFNTWVQPVGFSPKI